jgi:hypothetical protein
MDKQNSIPTGFSQQRYRTLRLTFSYEGAKVQLISQQSIEMTPPPPDPAPLQTSQSGFWYELRDESDRILYQRSVHNPIQFERTVYSNDPEIPMRKINVENPQGVFELLAPDIKEAQTIVLFSSPIDPELAANPATELARFELVHGSLNGGVSQ